MTVPLARMGQSQELRPGGQGLGQQESSQRRQFRVLAGVGEGEAGQQQHSPGMAAEV